MIEIILARHGETDWNAAEIFRGHADVALNENGIRQAEMLGKYLAPLDIDAVYSSPLQRAQQTAGAIAAPHSLEVKTAEGLIDIDFGEWQGMSLREVVARFKDIHDDWVYLPEQVRLPGGECLDEVKERAANAVAGIVEAHKAEGRVVLVSHRVVNKVLICAMLGLDNTHFRNIRIDTCGITTFTCEMEEFVLIRHNDTSFLEPLGHALLSDF